MRCTRVRRRAARYGRAAGAGRTGDPSQHVAGHKVAGSAASAELRSVMQWETKHLSACEQMMTAPNRCQIAADVPDAGAGAWADLKSHKYAEDCETGLDGEKGYRITVAGRTAYEAEVIARLRRPLWS